MTVRTISVALPYAVSIRDFINSGALERLRGVRDVRLVIHTINTAAPEIDGVRGPNVEVVSIDSYVDGPLEARIKRLFPLFFYDTFTYVRFAIGPRFARRLIPRLLTAVRRMLGTRRFLRLYGLLLLNLYKRRRVPPQLDPTTNLFVGTRSLINSLDYGLLAEATSRNFPVLILSGSWDNFTTKGFFPFPVRRAAVWNEKMKRELVELFGVDESRIEIVGYPRARLLRESVTPESPAEYLRELGIEGYSGFVLYAASYGELTRPASGGVPHEYLLAREIARRLSTELPADICILVRLHPFSSADDERLFAGIPRCHVQVPGRADKYVERVMGRSDERHLAMQIARSACVVSMASTISIDCLCLGKPVINVAYDPLPGVPIEASVRRFYEFNHFRDLVRIAKLPLAGSLDDVSRFVSASLRGEHPVDVDMRSFREFYVPEISAHYATNVVKLIEAMS